MGVAEDQGAELHNADEAGKVHDFGVGISPIKDSRQIEQLCALVDFCPKPLFESFFGRTESGGLFD